MLPVLRLISRGKQTIPECLPELAQEFSLSAEDQELLLPSGKQTLLANRAHWARTYLNQAGLVRAVKRGSYIITDSGHTLLSENLPEISNSTLKRYEAFRVWLTKSSAVDDPLKSADPSALIPAANTPEDSMEAAHKILDTALREELIGLVREVKPVRFEQLILDLLTAMGYGARELANSTLTKATGDGGIDGIIHEDALGLDAVYIQAKRYAAENKVGRPAIQQFVGSLTGEGATKGVFVTTSDFSVEARGYLNKVQHRIVLINGDELAKLMIRHGVGVRPRSTYVVKGIDEDYFSELDAD